MGAEQGKGGLDRCGGLDPLDLEPEGLEVRSEIHPTGPTGHPKLGVFSEVDARRALRRRLEAIADSGGDDAATARTAAARLAPPRPPPPPKRRRSAVTDLILGS